MKYKTTIDKMTLEQKASLMSGKDFWQTMDIAEFNIPSIFLADGPNGMRKQVEASDHLGLNESLKATCFPSSASLANTWNPLLIETMATLLGAEAVAQKVNMVLGPGVNIKRNPLCGRNFEYYSEDPYLAGKMSAAFIRGIQNHGISACVKHFAANNQEYRRMSIDSIIDERTLREIYLQPFEIAVKQGKTKAVMSSYNKVNGQYSNENQHLLRDILRKEWQFNGVLVSDWGGNNNRVEALKASAELEMPTTGGETNQEIVEAIKSGKLDENILNEAVDRLLDLAFSTSIALKESSAVFDAEFHHLLARKVAEESMVLLKNENQVLPIKAIEKVAIIGDFAQKIRFQGTGSSGVNPSKLENILDVTDESDFQIVGFEKGYNRYGQPSKKLKRNAVTLTKKADKVLLFLGLDEQSEIEGLDRKNLNLPKNQLDLLVEIAKTNNNVIVVLSAGSVIDMNWDHFVQGILHTYLPGQAGARAIIDLLVGKSNPSGKLSETYPMHYEDIPSSSNFPSLENTAEYREGLYVGYRYFDKLNKTVKYPFGFGLSYTTFEYSDLQINLSGVRFKIANLGVLSGKEIAQVYIGKKDSSIFRAEKELKGFLKENIETHQVKEIFIPFDEFSFRYFNVKTNKYEIEDGIYQIYVGASLNDIRLQGEIEIEGTKAVAPYDLTKCSSYVFGNVSEVPNREFEYLLGHEVPNPHFVFYKKKRMKINYNTTVQQLRYARGWTGRTFAFFIRIAPKFLRFFGARDAANVIMMGLYHIPMRGLSRQTGGAITWEQLNGLIDMFNGHFFRGLKHYVKSRKKRS
ncbi:MAG: glycoside hydrolase family 3 C-terminal domain-containing protein [Acholeplasmataceae bacterium]|nr:glycoside hydrolase family 3 C-terminal domain-containing protein [Acholeplasmataceae bacterium]